MEGKKKSLNVTNNHNLKDLKNKTNKDALLITQLQSELNKFKEFKVDVESKKLIQQSEIQRLTIKCQEYEDVIEENQLEIEKLKKEIEIISDLEKDRDNYKQLYDELDIEFKRFQCKANENELELETLQLEVKRLKEKCVEFYQKIDEDSKTHELLKNELKVFQHIVGEQDKIIRGKNQQEKGAHPAYCNACNKFIVGVRYKCGNCDDYDICSNCETSNHDRTHVFIKIKQPIENDKFFRTFLLPKIKIIEKDENDHKVICDVCHKSIKGVRYKCGHCIKFEMCVNCESYPFSLHDQNHIFIKIKRPSLIELKEPLLPLNFRPIEKNH
nr:6776_t:CDS:2 [Entrophospora candida]